jgi:hypothetical protein
MPAGCGCHGYTEFPGRVPGCLITLSALNHELDEGRLWPRVADWRAVVRALIALTRTPGRCESMPLGDPPLWPGDGLIEPPDEPAATPGRP